MLTNSIAPEFRAQGYGKVIILLAENIFGKENISKKLSVVTQELFYPTVEYWCGFVLAYCQWKNNLTFQKILDNYPSVVSFG